MSGAAASVSGIGLRDLTAGERPQVGQILGAPGKVTAVEQISDPGGPPLELPEEPAKRGGKGAKKR